MLDSQVCVVTGATGFVANELIVQLLQSGYTVRGTVRSPDSLKRVTHLGKIAEAMQAALSFHPVDLLKSGSLDQVIKGKAYNQAKANKLCATGSKYVFHVASPVMITAEDHQRDIVDPALEGTRNLMEAVRKSGSVKKLVITSSISSMEPCTPDGKLKNGKFLTTEDVTADATVKDSPYMFSKVAAEKVAYDMAREHSIDLVSIHPSLIMGTVYSSQSTFSVECMKGIIEGTSDLFVNHLIDVADVARAHILAAILPEAKGRYILSLPDDYPPKEVAQILSDALPEYKFKGHKDVEKKQFCDNSKTIQELGMTLSPPEVFLPAMVRCMIRLGLAKPVEQ